MDEFSFETLEPVPFVARPATPAEPVAADERTADAGPSPAVLAAAELESARAEAAAIREAAYQEGLQAGRADALGAAAPGVAALQAAVTQVRAAQAASAERLEAQSVELAFALADKVVGGLLEARPELVLETVRGALRCLTERDRITILVNPEDMELVGAALQGLRGELGGIEHCDVHAERRVGRGGAVVRHADGEVDARVETKLERAREVVAAALAGDAG
jgi:flagellar biosynthesis/type III secretory pathway protein FliH